MQPHLRGGRRGQAARVGFGLHWSRDHSSTWVMERRVLVTRMLSCFSPVWLFATLWTVACQASLSMRILQARILNWVAMPSPSESSWPKDWTCISYACCTGRWVLYQYHLGSLANFISITKRKNSNKTVHNTMVLEFCLHRNSMYLLASAVPEDHLFNAGCIITHGTASSLVKPMNIGS